MESKRAPKSFYEKRLHFFAFDPKGRAMLEYRLSANGTRSVTLPKLAIDEEVSHSLSDLVMCIAVILKINHRLLVVNWSGFAYKKNCTIVFAEGHWGFFLWRSFF
jgi:hypothetical protein